MKQVLIINASPMFQEYLRGKLIAEGINVEVAEGRRDAFTKLVSILPDLVIMNLDSAYDLSDFSEFFEKKKPDPNAGKIPVIIAGPELEREKILPLREFGVIKYFNKPIKFDLFFAAIGHVLKAGFTIDTTPAIIDIHLNNNIIFIEIARGLNRDKISLLKYKISELIIKNKIQKPKIILMMTDLSLSFIDGANLEILLDNILSDVRIQKNNVKILSNDKFIKDLVKGHQEYKEIEVAKNLPNILNKLIDSSSSSNIADLILKNILYADKDTNEGSIEMKFSVDTGVKEEDDSAMLKIAIVDDDLVTRKLLFATFNSINASCDMFDSAPNFLSATNKKKYDIVILDIFMPGISGFDILQSLLEKKYNVPVIVYSQAKQKEAIVKSFSLGARAYLIKPQKPDVILKKVSEIITPNANVNSGLIS